ncbi:sugar phosphate isomerase/epimerase family protein [Comamonas sp.]|uniref:sugar phosphate isomerase/epimerase family protein n=1 Tax=Comamonas sp. TaxID=34028 RepID=UPI003A91C507
MSLPELSLGWLSLPDASPTELIYAAADAGFAGVSLRVAPSPGDAASALSAQPQRVREVRAALAATGVRLAEMGSIRMHGPVPSSWCLPSLDVGASLGAETVIALIYESHSQKRLDDFCDLCHAAGQFGLRVAIEFAAFTSVPTVEAAYALVTACAMPNAGLVVDALHLERSGGTAAALANIPTERVFLAQLCDAWAKRPSDAESMRLEARTDRLDPGFGVLPLVDFVSALPDSFPLELEVPCMFAAPISAGVRAQQIAERTRHFLSYATAPKEGR